MGEKSHTFAALRAKMVSEQLQDRGITDSNVLQAMGVVPRERFVLRAYRDLAYEDSPLPLWAGQTISQPFIVAYMLAALQLEPHNRVLEIGTGSGYEAAVLSRIVREVFSMERHERLVQFACRRLKALGYNNIHIRHGDGSRGWPQFAPYAAIVVSAGGPHVPPALAAQLAVGGRLVMPIGRHTHQQILMRFAKGENGVLLGEELGPVAFVPLIGAEGWADERCDFAELAHTADIGLRVRADSLPGLYACAGKALFHLLGMSNDQEEIVPPRQISLSATDRESLLVDWLNELLYLHETTGEFYTYFRLVAFESGYLEAVVYGCRLKQAPLRHIKAATYHQLRIVKEKGSWQAEIYFDI